MPQSKVDQKPETKHRSHLKDSQSHKDFNSRWVMVTNPGEVKGVLDSIHVPDPEEHSALMVAHDENGTAFHAVYSAEVAKEDKDKTKKKPMDAFSASHGTSTDQGEIPVTADTKFKKIYDRGDIPEHYGEEA